MKPGQILARRRNESRQAGDEIQWLEDHVRRAVGRWVRFARSARSALRETISASRRGMGFSACSRCRRELSGTGAFLKQEGALDLTLNFAGKGQVTASPEQETYLWVDELTLVAEPDFGQVFIG